VPTSSRFITCFGFGAVVGAALLPRVKRRFTVNAVVALATVLFALVSAVTALWRFIPGLGIAMMLGGVAWIAMMASLNSAAQTAVPAWVRARALGIYLIVFQGGLGVGSALWRTRNCTVFSNQASMNLRSMRARTSGATSRRRLRLS